MKSVNPATGQVIQEYQAFTWDHVQKLIARAHHTSSAWRAVPGDRRVNLMRALGSTISQSREKLARLMTLEMGKPIRQAIAEIDKCGRLCEYYAEHGRQMLQIQECPTEAARSYVRFDPLGVLLGIMPWNFPYWQLFRFAVPSVMGGNIVLLKHSAGVCGCAIAIQELFQEAGFPPGVLTTLLIDSATVSRVIEHPVLRGISLTGSDAAGRAVAEQAGRHLRRCVLELGGSDPFIVLADADLTRAAQTGAQARLQNAGQSCIAAKRFLVEESVADSFQSALVREMQALRAGDPLDQRTDLGPMARRDLRDELHRQVQDSIEAGARCILGGSVPDGPGYFYPATVLTDVRPGMPAFDDEMFGPVAAVIRVKDAAEAIRVANGSRFGLGASVWTSDRELGERMAGELESGMVFINEMTKSDARMPFGGVKDSGFGRELGEFGIREFMNVKTVWVS